MVNFEDEKKNSLDETINHIVYYSPILNVNGVNSNNNFIPWPVTKLF